MYDQCIPRRVALAARLRAQVRPCSLESELHTDVTHHSDLTALSAVALRAAIGRRDISPVELMDACIERIAAFNPAINAIAATDFARARTAARAAEQAVMRGDTLGPLHGLPLGVKDLLDTAGLLTTSGNVGRRNHVPAHDNTLVARLRAAGAIVTAKTNVPDMGAGANTRNAVWGATGNPFNPALNAGGSSGGSAAALALDMLPLATGSDTGGSLRIPAALCGVVGLRPSPGVVANNARPLGWSVISVLGPMARDVADTALMLRASTGIDPRDPLSYAVPDLAAPLPTVDLSRMRIGTTEDFGICPVDPSIRRSLRLRVKALEGLGARCEPVTLDVRDADRVFDILRAESFHAGYADTLRRAPETLAPHVRANIEMAGNMTLADRAWAHVAQTQIAQRFARAFDDFDLIIAPTSPVSPFPWTTLYAEQVDGQAMRNYYQWLALTYVPTLATNPALALPCGLDEAGMPFGLQLIGPLRGDARLLAMASALEQAFAGDAALRRPLPDLQALQSARPELRSIVTHAPGTGSGDAMDTTATAV